VWRREQVLTHEAVPEVPEVPEVATPVPHCHADAAPAAHETKD
jgi:hypothetical protein